MEDNNLELMSGEVRQILTQPPSAVTSLGTLVLGAVVALLLLTGIFYQYPETVKGELTLTTAVPPVPVKAPQTGYISVVKVPENDTVSKGDILAVFASNAEVEDVLKLENEVELLSNADLSDLFSYRPDQQLRLGELASYYASVESIFSYLSQGQDNAPNPQQMTISEIQRHIQQLNTANRTLENQKVTAEEEYKLFQREFRAATKDYEKSTSDEDSRKQLAAYSKMTRKASEISTIEAQIEANKAMIIDDNSRIFELRSQEKTGANDKIAQLKQNLGTLKAEIQRWKDKYLVIAPADGKVSYYSELAPKQLLTVGEDMLAIVPLNAGDNYVGEVKISAEGSGKVKIGQTVNLMFDRYNFREWGLVKGTVKKIYPLMKGNKYSVEIELKKGLITTKDRTLGYHLQMGGTAEIITEDKSFVRRIFSKLLG
jgi:HlyD family secretion protein